MIIQLLESIGIKLKIAGKFCKENIMILLSLQNKNITNNETITPDDGYAGLSSVNVNVPMPTGTTKITSNGLHSVTNFSIAEVNVPIPADYIKPSGTKTITANNTYSDVKSYAYAEVNIPTISDTSDANATASYIAKDKIAYTKTGRTVGTMSMGIHQFFDSSFTHQMPSNTNLSNYCAYIIDSNNYRYGIPLMGINSGKTKKIYPTGGNTKYIQVTSTVSNGWLKLKVSSNYITISKWTIVEWKG